MKGEEKTESSEELRFNLTIESGVLCMDWSDFHGKAEELMGHPVWTHEFADDDFILEMKTRLLTQHKTTREESVIETNPLESLKKKVDPDKIMCVVMESE